MRFDIFDVVSFLFQVFTLYINISVISIFISSFTTWAKSYSISPKISADFFPDGLFFADYLRIGWFEKWAGLIQCGYFFGDAKTFSKTFYVEVNYISTKCQ